MTCPNCGEMLRERERSGIEIDVCPQCRGIWLDRGELDKLLAREAQDYGESDTEADRNVARTVGRGRESYDDEPEERRGFFQRLMDTLGEGGD